jgi:hypothetical protein
MFKIIALGFFVLCCSQIPILFADIRADTMPVVYPLSLFDQYSDWKTRKATYDPAFNGLYGYANMSLAQSAEEIWLYENWFYGMTNGVILESGALNGLTYSTSFMFQYFLGWFPIHIGNPDV